MRDIIAGAYAHPSSGTDDTAALTEAVVNEHCAEHAQALIELEHMVNVSTDSHELDQRKLADDLRNWFVSHALEHDASLKAFFQTYENR
jgi:hemerythrin